MTEWDFSQFHLLRPWWLLALLPLAALPWLKRRQQAGYNPWAKLVDPHLLPSLTVKPAEHGQHFPMTWLIIGWLLAVLALSGPTWSRLPQPVYEIQQARIYLLDLSRSMDSGDLPPSRLAQARYKLLDILKQAQEGQSALIAFAGGAHIVSPLTDDTGTITALVPVLSSNLVPLQGSRPETAINLAVDLLAQAGVAHGDVILIGDGSIDPTEAQNAARELRQKGHRLSVLAVGTEEGAPIPLKQGFLKNKEGEIVIPALDSRHMQELAELGNGLYTTIRTDNRDIESLLSFTDRSLEADQRLSDDKQAQKWREYGPWLLLILLPIVAAGFRRGWLLAPLVVFLIPPPAQAFDWQSLWVTQEQQGQQAMDQDRPKEAATLFTDPQRRGAAQYRSGDYEAALESFQQGNTPIDLYNQGNAYAYNGDLQNALKAYEAALEKRPNFLKAQQNRELIEELLKQQSSQQQNQNDAQKDQEKQDQEQQDQQQNNASSGSGDKQDQQQDQDPSSASEQSQNADSSEEEQQPQDAQSENAKEEESQEGEKSDPQAPEEQQQQARAQNAQPGQNAEAQPLDPESEQAMEQWLRRIPDDPGGLLREKFRREFRRRGTQRSQGEPAW